LFCDFNLALFHHLPDSRRAEGLFLRMEGLGFYLLGKLRQWCVLAIAHLPFSLLRKGRFGYEFVAEAIEGDGRIQPAHRRGSQTVEYVALLTDCCMRSSRKTPG